MRTAIRTLAALLALGLATMGIPVAMGAGTAAAAASERTAETEPRNVPGGVASRSSDKLDLEDHSDFSNEYIFGMTKGVMRSTLNPALKPLVLIVTIPLDLVLLPFAAVGGFFR